MKVKYVKSTKIIQKYHTQLEEAKHTKHLEIRSIGTIYTKKYLGQFIRSQAKMLYFMSPSF